MTTSSGAGSRADAGGGGTVEPLEVDERVCKDLVNYLFDSKPRRPHPYSQPYYSPQVIVDFLWDGTSAIKSLSRAHLAFRRPDHIAELSDTLLSLFRAPAHLVNVLPFATWMPHVLQVSKVDKPNRASSTFGGDVAVYEVNLRWSLQLNTSVGGSASRPDKGRSSEQAGQRSIGQRKTVELVFVRGSRAAHHRSRSALIHETVHGEAPQPDPLVGSNPVEDVGAATQLVAVRYHLSPTEHLGSTTKSGAPFLYRVASLVFLVVAANLLLPLVYYFVCLVGLGAATVRSGQAHHVHAGQHRRVNGKGKERRQSTSSQVEKAAADPSPVGSKSFFPSTPQHVLDPAPVDAPRTTHQHVGRSRRWSTSTAASLFSEPEESSLFEDDDKDRNDTASASTVLAVTTHVASTHLAELASSARALSQAAVEGASGALQEARDVAWTIRRGVVLVTELISGVAEVVREAISPPVSPSRARAGTGLKRRLSVRMGDEAEKRQRQYKGEDVGDAVASAEEQGPTTPTKASKSSGTASSPTSSPPKSALSSMHDHKSPHLHKRVSFSAASETIPRPSSPTPQHLAPGPSLLVATGQAAAAPIGSAPASVDPALSQLHHDASCAAAASARARSESLSLTYPPSHVAEQTDELTALRSLRVVGSGEEAGRLDDLLRDKHKWEDVDALKGAASGASTPLAHALREPVDKPGVVETVIESAEGVSGVTMRESWKRAEEEAATAAMSPSPGLDVAPRSQRGRDPELPQGASYLSPLPSHRAGDTTPLAAPSGGSSAAGDGSLSPLSALAHATDAATPQAQAQSLADKLHQLAPGERRVGEKRVDTPLPSPLKRRTEGGEGISPVAPASPRKARARATLSSDGQGQADTRSAASGMMGEREGKEDVVPPPEDEDTDRAGTTTQAAGANLEAKVRYRSMLDGGVGLAPRMRIGSPHRLAVDQLPTPRPSTPPRRTVHAGGSSATSADSVDSPTFSPAPESPEEKLDRMRPFGVRVMGGSHGYGQQSHAEDERAMAGEDEIVRSFLGAVGAASDVEEGAEGVDQDGATSTPTAASFAEAPVNPVESLDDLEVTEEHRGRVIGPGKDVEEKPLEPTATPAVGGAVYEGETAAASSGPVNLVDFYTPPTHPSSLSSPFIDASPTLSSTSWASAAPSLAHTGSTASSPVLPSPQMARKPSFDPTMGTSRKHEHEEKGSPRMEHESRGSWSSQGRTSPSAAPSSPAPYVHPAHDLGLALDTTSGAAGDASAAANSPSSGSPSKQASPSKQDSPGRQKKHRPNKGSGGGKKKGRK
ncbi:hypothetical protein JCM10207_000360 [Rhodosporidiobolus poonsookiae]